MATEERNDLYTIDIRVFLVTMTVAMVAAFVAGVSMAPPDPSLLASGVPSNPGMATSSKGPTPEVHDSFFNLSKEDMQIPDDQHLPAGQHLLVDIEGVDEDFLNSEERLSKAMVDTVNDAGLHMLSYHCHALIPSGVSCVGVLLESHISFHTWPSEGVITLDLFTCGNKPLLPAVATIERLFGIQDTKDPTRKIHTQWSHELRGFRPEEEVKKNYLADSSDLSLWVLSPLEMHSKTQIFSGRTKYQQVDIWDIVEVRLVRSIAIIAIHLFLLHVVRNLDFLQHPQLSHTLAFAVQLVDTPSYQDILKHNMTPGDPRSQMTDYVTPDRLLFLDGTIQSLHSTERVYHEAMVHSAMFAHPGPKRVAIVGGGEGATLREVLKHKTLESVFMIEIDRELVDISKQYLPSFSDCSDLVGRAASCFDDEIAKMFYEDARQWFINRYGSSPTITPELNAMDVVLVDALDPEDQSDISDLLYNDDNFLESMVNSLSDKGVLVIQIGTAATIDDPRPDFGIYRQREALFRKFESNPKIEAMFVYEEPHAGYLEPHSYLLVCRSVDCRSRWYARSDQVDYQIYDRIVRTHSKTRALSYYDGTTQRTYQWPKKGWETLYCRREPTPFECAYRVIDSKAELHELDLEDEDESSFRVEKIESESEDPQYKVFAKKRIPKGSFIMAEHLASSLMITSRNYEGLRSNVNVGGGRVAIIEDLLEYFKVYAHPSHAPGSEQHYVEVGGSVLLRRSKGDDANVGRWMPPHPSGKRPVFSPVYERHRVSFDVFLVASKDIEVGEEVVMADSVWNE